MASLNTAVAEQQPVNSKFRVLTASLVGTTIEFFDFYIYATAAVIKTGRKRVFVPINTRCNGSVIPSDFS